MATTKWVGHSAALAATTVGPDDPLTFRSMETTNSARGRKLLVLKLFSSTQEELTFVQAGPRFELDALYETLFERVQQLASQLNPGDTITLRQLRPSAYGEPL